MADLVGSAPPDRRRHERRVGQRFADLTLPEFRRILLTSVLFAIVLVMFLWMVHTVIIAGILAVIVAVYVEPIYAGFLRAIRRPAAAATLTITLVLVPLIGGAIYSYVELRDAAQYVSANQDEVVRRIDDALRRLPFFGEAGVTQQVRQMVARASNAGAEIVGELREAAVTLSISTAVFLFTAFYIFTQREEIVQYVRSKVPPRYGELATALERNVRGVLYGAIYATLVTQTVKSLVILGLNVLFDVPLALVLAILSFIIGFFPIVGSWSVYVPVAIYLIIFRDALTSALIMLAVGFLGNTVFLSMYLRPKLAAEKSRVLNFYWMFIALVTGVYTFGIVGILLGPIIIGLLKAVFDTVTAHDNWRRLLDVEGDLLDTGAAGVETVPRGTAS